MVIKDVPSGAIVGENPAKVFKECDMEHFNILLEKRNFINYAMKLVRRIQYGVKHKKIGDY